MADLFATAPAPRPAADLAPKSYVPCTGPARRGAHVCAAGGGEGVFSGDHGKTWACRNHVPADFFSGLRQI